MARKRGDDVNKSQLIRDYTDDNPDMKPKEMVKKIKEEKGIELTTGFIGSIKSQYKKKKRGGGKKRGRKPGSGRLAGANDQISLSLLKSAKQLADKLGGVDEARKILNALAELA